MGMAMAAMKPDRIAGVVLNDAGPEIDPAGLHRIAGYAGKLPPVSSWAEAAAQAKSIYGLAQSGLTDEDWLDYAHRGFRENAAGIPVPDVDPKISAAFKNTSTAPADLRPLYSQIKAVPMLVIRGALSDGLSAATVARMAREKPDLQHIAQGGRLRDNGCRIAGRSVRAYSPRQRRRFAGYRLSSEPRRGELGTQVVAALRECLAAPLKAVLMTGDTSSAIKELPRDPYLWVRPRDAPPA